LIFKILEDIYSLMDINEDNGLVDNTHMPKTPYQYYFFNHVKEKMNIDSIYFLRMPGGEARIPLIYFTAMDTYNSEKIAELHKLAWNLGEAPFLFIVLPDQLIVYNNFENPRLKDGKLDESIGIIESIKIVKNLEIARQKLFKYHRINLESGEFWHDPSNRFNISTRVDNTLIENLALMRLELLKSISDTAIVHTLLGRAILIKYLEDRKDKNGNKVLNNNIYGQFLLSANSFTDILKDKEATYEFFTFLQKKFNGDLFPVTQNEQDIVKLEDLQLLRLFLSGEIYMGNGQLTFFPLYSFDVIPIQLISSIYEMFFHLENSKETKNGTYYTPYHLVELLMDEVFPWEGQYKAVKVLDPACGSGIFLVEAFRRLVGRWIFENQKPIEVNQLKSILTDCIYGVDYNTEALRMASFSLCLALCDYLDSESIWTELRFPAMRKGNLFSADFFDCKEDFNNYTFRVIIGNPPWESKLSEHAKKYIYEQNYPIGDNQIAQAFSWRVADFSDSETNICLLMPSKGFLFNRSDKNNEYRNKFFTQYSVSTIINFSVFRKVLFEHASGPATAVFYRINKPDYNEPIYYCSPKPTHTIEDQRRFLIEPNSICKIPRDRCLEKYIWKVGMWGGPRDLELLKKINKHAPFENYAKNQFVYAEGFIVGSKGKPNTDYVGVPEINTKKVNRYKMEKDECSLCTKTKFYRIASTNKVIFKAPHLLIKQAPKQQKGFYATYLDFDAIFSQSFVGVHGDAQTLKYLSLLFNSRIFTYFALMTSSRWLIERDEVEEEVIKEFPIPDINIEEYSDKINYIYEEVIKDSSKGQILVEQFAIDLFKLTYNDVKMIDDAIDLTYNEFAKGSSSPAKSKPKSKDLSQYTEVLEKSLTSSFGTPMQVECLQSNSPLVIARLSCLNKNENAPISFSESGDLEKELEELDSLLLEKKSQGVFIRRNVRIYEKDNIYVVKPNQKKYWSFSAAFRDADDMFADIMRAWRNYQ